MDENIKIILKVIWGILLLYWTISGLMTKKVENQESVLIRFLQYWFPLIVAVLLLGPGDWFGHTIWREALLPHSNEIGIIGLVFCFIGAIVAIWSRYLLGKNWSLSVQKKMDHQLVKTGLYKIIRHPIYTGLLFMFIGNSVIVGDYRVIPALFIVFFSFWFKIKKEEKLMIEVFSNDYIEYMQTTKAFIPYIL